MHSLVDHYDVPGSEGAEMEAAREAARMNIDAMGVVAMSVAAPFLCPTQIFGARAPAQAHLAAPGGPIPL